MSALCVSVFIVVSGIFTLPVGLGDEAATLTAVQQEDQGAMPLGWPLVSREFGWISSIMGMRKSPFTGEREFHTGIDISAVKGTVVVATAPGTVARTIDDAHYGLCLVIEHGDYETFYGHLDEIAVKPGDSVAKGEAIGKLGNTGKSTGPHLHYEVRLLGNYMNPRDYTGRQ